MIYQKSSSHSPQEVEQTLREAVPRHKFGVLHVLDLKNTLHDKGIDLDASHYFQTALDLTFCISDRADPKQRGFYLVKVMGSEQAGLTGFKGSIVRKVAVGRSASTLRKSLASIKAALEALP